MKGENRALKIEFGATGNRLTAHSVLVGNGLGDRPQRDFNAKSSQGQSNLVKPSQTNFRLDRPPLAAYVRLTGARRIAVLNRELLAPSPRF